MDRSLHHGNEKPVKTGGSNKRRRGPCVIIECIVDFPERSNASVERTRDEFVGVSLSPFDVTRAELCLHQHDRHSNYNEG